MFTNFGLASKSVARIAIALVIISSFLAAAPSARAADADSIDVKVSLNTCPDGFDGINASIYDFAANCHSPLGGIDFQIDYANIHPVHQTELDGTWTFTDLPPGQFVLGEYPP